MLFFRASVANILCFDNTWSSASTVELARISGQLSNPPNPYERVSQHRRGVRVQLTFSAEVKMRQLWQPQVTPQNTPLRLTIIRGVAGGFPAEP